MQRRSLVIRTLLATARQRAGMDEPRCRVILELIEAAEVVRSTLRTKIGIPEGRFAALVALFATDPSPISSAEIAEHAGISRSAITEVLDRLEADQLIIRQRDTIDRRIVFVNLTDQGRAVSETAVTGFLSAAGKTADQIPPASFETLIAAFEQLHAGAHQFGATCTPPDNFTA